MRNSPIKECVERNRKLVDFLIEKEALGKFLNDMNNFVDYSAFYNLDEMIIRDFSLRCAFNWADSKEGHNYWSDLTEEFEAKTGYTDGYRGN